MTADAPPTRNTERTRRAVLAAAARVVVRDGTGAAIGAVATEAGVSKGGLLHHFPSREALFVALTTETLDGFRRRVHERVDLSENRPGKLLRAYVRAMCDELAGTDVDDAPEWAALAILRASPAVADLVRADAGRWEADLAADGLDPGRVLLVRLAADGLGGLALQDEALARRHLRRVRPLLLGLADTGPVPLP